jgi:Arc/MetJ-type ribon-helix-helix transcriptional regulator
MTVLKTRSRMVSVRLSEDEYIALRELCSSTGSRSVSDLTRDAMRAFLRGTNREESLHNRMGEFCDQMNQLGRRIDELVEKFAPSSKQIEP